MSVRMIKPERFFSGQRSHRAHVTWYVGPVTQPDSLRTGRLIRVEGERALVQPTEEVALCWMNVADLEGVPARASGPRLVRPQPEQHPALDLPAPVAESLELLGLLHLGVEILPGQHTTLKPVLEQLVTRGFLVDRGEGRWELTARGREVIDG